jgi:hypothetical protein
MEALLPQITRRPLRKIAMRFSERTREQLSSPQSERDYSSDTTLGNRARVSKPIEITDRVFLSVISGGKHWNEPLPMGGHVIRAPEFASVSCYLSIAVL